MESHQCLTATNFRHGSLADCDNDLSQTIWARSLTLFGALTKRLKYPMSIKISCSAAGSKSEGVIRPRDCVGHISFGVLRRADRVFEEIKKRCSQRGSSGLHLSRHCPPANQCHLQFTSFPLLNTEMRNYSSTAKTRLETYSPFGLRIAPYSLELRLSPTTMKAQWNAASSPSKGSRTSAAL